MLQNNSQLKGHIDKLWNAFWSGGIANPMTAIEQITYLIFMKRLDDLEAKRERDAKFTGEPYTSRFNGTWVPVENQAKFNDYDTDKQRNRKSLDQEKYAIEKSTLRWSHFKRMPADQMLLHVQTKVFPFLKTLNGETSAFTKHMANAVFIIPKPSLLVEAINIIELVFDEIAKDADQGGQAFQDIQGDVYEMLLSEIATAGKMGQFRTPRHIIKLMAELVEPQLGHKIADPACGTGGFLLGAYQYILSDLVRKLDPGKLVLDEDGFERGSMSAAHTEEVKKILEQSFVGYDIDTTMVRLGLMNLMMHGIDEPQINYMDTLSKKFTEEAIYDIVMANPPFTGSIDKGDINTDLTLGTTKTELLFVENIYRLLKKGGTACVIVPQGVLTSSGGAFKKLRQLLVDRCDLKAVITMPGGVFKPYAGVSTAILLFTKVWGAKDKVGKPATDQVWFYEMAADGYSLDDKRTKQDGNGDLQDIVARYHSRNAATDTDRSQKFFMVSRADIEAREYDLGLTRYNDPIFEEMQYESPSVILDKLLKAEVGEVGEKDLSGVQSGIVRELLELRGMVG